MIKDKIKSLRLKHSLSQEELAKRAGVSYNTVAKIEQGVIKNPGMKTLLSIAKALGVSLDVLAKIFE